MKEDMFLNISLWYNMKYTFTRKIAEENVEVFAILHVLGFTFWFRYPY